MTMTRRNFAARAAAMGLLAKLPMQARAQQAMPAGRLATSAERQLAAGPFQPTWESLRAGYKPPAWFRDAKFGIWAHWSAQCVPEQGDWYGRRMYIQGEKQNLYHVKTYGHPSKVGFKDIDCMWKVDQWRPEELLDLYQKAGAKYFMALANHHDDFDTFRSRHHEWNATRVGPMRDIIGTWRKAVRERGMKFAVSNHSAHAWHWLQPAYGYDAEGPMAGVRYDAYQLMKNGVAAGKGTAWAGLDPQELYVGPSYVLPDGIKTMAEAAKWHSDHDAKWDENPPEAHPEFVNRWFLRCKDLMDTYEPDMVYFDDTELPLGQAGLDATAHFYNSTLAKRGKLDVVVTGKGIRPEHKGAIVLDLERGRTDKILDEPWQVDTCIGDWHYNREVFEQHRYKTPKSVIQILIDAVSKNGNLCLSVPVRGNGEIDSDEKAIVEGIGAWMQGNSEGIYGSRPFEVFGEGPPEEIAQGNFNEGKGRPYTGQDIRFTTKGGKLYAYTLGPSDDDVLRIKTLGTNGTTAVKKVERVELLGSSAPLKFEQTADALVVTLPESKRAEFAVGVKIFSGSGEVASGE
jgi:alpha-L-fucosidase